MAQNYVRFKYLTIEQTARGILACGIVSNDVISFDSISKSEFSPVRLLYLNKEKITRTLLDSIVSKEQPWIELKSQPSPFSAREIFIQPIIPNAEDQLNRIAVLYEGMPYSDALQELEKTLCSCIHKKSINTKLLVDLIHLIPEEKAVNDECYAILEEAI